MIGCDSDSGTVRARYIQLVKGAFEHLAKEDFFPACWEEIN